MYHRNSILAVLNLSGLLAGLGGSAYASNWTLDIEKSIRQEGYELSTEGIRKALSARDWEVLPQCLEYIEREQIVELLPDVKAFFKEVDQQEMYEGIKLVFVTCILSIDKEMKKQEQDAFVDRIRKLLFGNQYNTLPIEGYVALLAAQKYQGVDIYGDLLLLSCADIMKGGDFPSDCRKLFELYGDRVTEADLDKMLEASKDSPKRQGFILRRAREHGLRLEEMNVQLRAMVDKE